MPKSIIDQLNSVRGLEIECPNCGGAFPARRAHFFSIKEQLPERIQKILAERNKDLHQELDSIKERRKELLSRKKEKPKKIKVTTEAVNFGKIIEKIVPAFQAFPFHPLDCRALYEPIDYVVFNDLSKKGTVDSISFADVKSGHAGLQDNQNQIKLLVENGKVKLTVTSHE